MNEELHGINERVRNVKQRRIFSSIREWITPEGYLSPEEKVIRYFECEKRLNRKFIIFYADHEGNVIREITSKRELIKTINTMKPGEILFDDKYILYVKMPLVSKVVVKDLKKFKENFRKHKKRVNDILENVEKLSKKINKPRYRGFIIL